ncbi:unnamed protein product [Closterium sp. NIES-65]|nr:unnamed protein product [Closterium sp. NIES-65]
MHHTRPLLPSCDGSGVPASPACTIPPHFFPSCILSGASHQERALVKQWIDVEGHTASPPVMDRALVNQWIDVEGHTFSPPVMVLVYERVFKPHLHKRPCDEERWKEAREKVRGRVERRRAFGLFSPLVVYERVFKPHLHKR